LGNAANGVFKLSEAMTAVKNGTWPAYDPFFENTTLLLHGDGTNGAQNNTFLDSSTNNFTITRNGNTTQGTFSPFSQTGWSNYFDGSGDYLDSAPGAIGTGDFTLECWVYFNSLASDQGILDTRGNSNTSGFALLGRSTGQISMADGTSLIGTAASASANTWIHVAASRASGVISFYVNGTRSGSTVANTTNFSNNRLRIGAIGSAGENLAGYVSNARLLTSAIYSGTTITVPTTPLTAISGTSLLTCQSNRFRDASTNNFAITVNGNTSVQAFSPFAPTAAYSAATVGGSGYFDGSGDYLSVASSSTLAFGTGDFTVEGWYYPLAYSGGVSTILSTTAADSASVAAVNVNVQTNGGLTVGDLYSTGSGTVPLNAWTHFVVSRVSGTIRLFINGAQGSSASNTTNYTSTGCLIGARFAGGQYYLTAAAYIAGLKLTAGSGVTSVTVPTAPPTGGNVLLNFTNGGIIDNTAKNVLETVGNAQISTSVKQFGTGSISFNRSTASYLAIPQPLNFTFGTGDFTIEFWLYLNQLPPTADGYGLFGTRPLFTNGAYLTLGMSQAGAFGFTTNGADVCASGNVAQASVWQHMAYTRSGSTVRIFRNGTQIATGTDSTNLGVGSGRAIVGSLDANPIVNYSIDGYIDDLRITKGIARYTSNFTPQTSQWQDQ
jgi:hypothetical protein